MASLNYAAHLGLSPHPLCLPPPLQGAQDAFGKRGVMLCLRALDALPGIDDLAVDPEPKRCGSCARTAAWLAALRSVHSASARVLCSGSWCWRGGGSDCRYCCCSLPDAQVHGLQAAAASPGDRLLCQRQHQQGGASWGTPHRRMGGWGGQDRGWGRSICPPCCFEWLGTFLQPSCL